MNFAKYAADQNSKYEPSSAENHPSQKMQIVNEDEAQKIVHFFSSKMRELYKDWSSWKVTLTEKEIQSYGTAYPANKSMELHASGENVATLLHEMAHQYGYGHDDLWKQTMVTLLDLYDACIDELVEKLKPETFKDEDFEDLWELAQDDLLGSAAADRISMLRIGTVLQQYEINSTENIRKMSVWLREQGLMIVALTENSPY